MQVNIYINDKFYKTIDTGPQDGYNLANVLSIVEYDKAAGLLTDFAIDGQYSIRIEPIIT